MESGHRWMEKEEVHSLRDAMAEMDVRDEERRRQSATNPDEQRIYDAALDEAAELVWQHQNPGSVPQPDGPYRYKSHLRKNSYAHARAANISDGRRSASSSRSVSASSTDSEEYPQNSRSSFDGHGKWRGLARPRNRKSYGSTSSHHRRSSMKRNVSGEIQRPFSGDQIWEEPEKFIVEWFCSQRWPRFARKAQQQAAGPFEPGSF